MRPTSTLWLLWATLFSVSVRAQTPATNPPYPAPVAQSSAAQDPTAPLPAVPLRDEPHHRLILQNDFVRVYSVDVPPLDATVLHKHDLPYLGVTLGAADLVNVVSGKPEAHVTLEDGQVIYSPGAYSHLVRTDAGTPFRNVTIELVRPQGTARNLCKEIIPGALGACPQQAAASKKNSSESADDEIAYFETDEARVVLIKIAGGRDYVDEAPKLSCLLIALTDANLDVDLGGQHISFLHGGDVLWLPVGTHRKVVDFLGTKSSFLLVSFKESSGAKP